MRISRERWKGRASLAAPLPLCSGPAPSIPRLPVLEVERMALTQTHSPLEETKVQRRRETPSEHTVMGSSWDPFHSDSMLWKIANWMNYLLVVNFYIRSLGDHVTPMPDILPQLPTVPDKFLTLWEVPWAPPAVIHGCTCVPCCL